MKNYNTIRIRMKSASQSKMSNLKIYQAKSAKNISCEKIPEIVPAEIYATLRQMKNVKDEWQLFYQLLFKRGGATAVNITGQSHEYCQGS